MVFFSPHQEEATSKILDSNQVDKNVKRLLETMQERIIKLEIENRKLKKEVLDLTNQNKKYQNQVGSFIHEQEKYAKIRDTYEKRIKRLEDYLKDNVELNSALQKILGLSEDEYFERVVAKRDTSSSPSPPKRLSTKSFDANKSIRRSPSRGLSMKLPAQNESGNTSLLEKSTNNQINIGKVVNRKIPVLILKKKNTVSFSDYSPLKGGRTVTNKQNSRTTSFFDFKGELEKA